jgi:CheY-like chemotaxis protein
VLPCTRKTTILVVEDDLGLREMYRTALMVAGYQVIAVEDGVDALRRIDTEPPGLVVLDMALPRLGGREVQNELKSRPDTNHIPIVVVSGTDTRNLSPREFDCVLRKPIAPNALLEAVEDCLRRVVRA